MTIPRQSRVRAAEALLAKARANQAEIVEGYHAYMTQPLDAMTPEAINGWVAKLERAKASVTRAEKTLAAAWGGAQPDAQPGAESEAQPGAPS